MARRKKPEHEPDIVLEWLEKYVEEGSRAPYNRWLVSYVLYGEHDVEHAYVEHGYDADGNLCGEWQTEPVTNPILVKWVDALWAFDKHHDKASLIALLESDTETLPIVGNWLADLVWRYKIPTDGVEDFIAQRRQLASLLRGFVLPPPKPGRPKVPTYDMSESDEALHVANNQVTQYRKKNGGTVSNATAVIASGMVLRIAAYQKKKGCTVAEAITAIKVTLKNFRDGARTSTRKAAERRR
jgi:hypothetical protein